MRDSLPKGEMMRQLAWAKSADAKGDWLTLEQHMRDAGEVGRWLVDHWLPPGSFAWATDNGWSPDLGGKVATFLCAAHDVGKATVAFASMSPPLYAAMNDAGLIGRSSVTGRQVHHTRTGYHLLLRYLTKRGLTRPEARSWATVIAGHHGAMPSQSELNNADPAKYPDFYGWDTKSAPLWQGVVDNLLDACWAQAGLDPLPGSPALPLAGQVVLGGLVITADWIASNAALFPLGAAEAGRSAHGIVSLGLPGPWRPSPTPQNPVEIYRRRFDLFAQAEPRPFQVDAVSAARWLPEPGLLLLEAAPGEGKTEAALAAAEVLAERFDMGGVFVALPTQATTDAMFSRVLTWLDHLEVTDLPVGSTLWLGHARRRLNRDYRGLPTIRLSNIHDDAGPASRGAAHEWLTRKKALLATTVVATIDQLLLAALPLKHGTLRFLGLAGKVVVIDEVHAYDPFMRTHLVRVLEWLAALRVPVVMLSATLPAVIRSELVRAYAGPVQLPDQGGAYPYITAVSGGQGATWSPASSGRRSSVLMERSGTDLPALADRLQALLADGGCALVVRNTVRSARETAAYLSEALEVPVECHHARFIAADRTANDQSLLERFGPPSSAVAAQPARPERAIVVATQVAEMSLDVDFDVLVTDLAPIDAILQRLGRCHRHLRARPPALARPRCIVLSDLDPAQEPVLDKGSVAVYGAATLLTTAAHLEDRYGATIELPEDIVGLVEGGYAVGPTFPKAWEEAFSSATAEANAAVSRREDTARAGEVRAPGSLTGGISGVPSLIGWLDAGSSDGDETDPHIQAAVRDARESVEVVLVDATPTGLQIPERVTGELIPLDPSRPLTRWQADALAGCVVRVTPPSWRRAYLVRAALVEGTPPKWRDEPMLGHWPVLALEAGRREIEGMTWSYSTDQGLEVQW